jgi:hypothetical protein
MSDVARARQPVEVTQPDREAAANLLDELSNLLDHNGIGQVADLIRDGEYDDHEATAAFARHRLAAQTPRDALSKALGYMMNARIDLETGETKATAIRTLQGGIKVANEALSLSRAPADSSRALLAEAALALALAYQEGFTGNQSDRDPGAVYVAILERLGVSWAVDLRLIRDEWR